MMEAIKGILIKEKYMSVPYCKKIVYDCPDCKTEMILPDEEDRCYECVGCQRKFCTEHTEAGELIIVLQPVDNGQPTE